MKLSNEGLSATPTLTHDHILNKVSIPVFDVWQLGKPNFECHKMIQNNPILRGIQLLTTKKNPTLLNKYCKLFTRYTCWIVLIFYPLTIWKFWLTRCRKYFFKTVCKCGIHSYMLTVNSTFYNLTYRKKCSYIHLLAVI